MNGKTTRRRFLGAATAGAAWVALGGTLGCEPETRARSTASSAHQGEQEWTFHSRPDLRPPVIRVTTPAHDTAPGNVFCAPKNGPGEAGPWQDGCLILDDTGQPVWFRPVAREAMDVMDFKVQTYKGESVLTWWEGHHTSYGQGEYVICNHSYREIARVKASKGYEGDHHEFQITPQGTALFDIYNKVIVDLSGLGGEKNATVLDGIVQEVDIDSGDVIFEWHSLEHVGFDESYVMPYDYFHLNSIDVDGDGNLLVSSRTTCTVYKIDRRSGEVIWRLGGKRSDFEMGPGTRTNFQHDARRQKDGTLTVFDNGNMNEVDQSRAVVLELDEKAMTARLIREYTHPDKVRSATQGNVQVLPNGNVFVGWGSAPALSEFSHDGRLRFSAAFPTEGESYRAFRFPWKGRPPEDPALVAKRGPEDNVTLYVSWNGATEVATWQVLAGPDPDRLEEIASAPRKGFETAIVLRTTETYVSVQARDSSGRTLGASKAARLGD
jgi:Arylsulfotransferase (ASST)